jgi:hypothetical protein
MAVVVVGLNLPAVDTVAGEPAFFVAPDGNDDNPGTLAEPFATIGRARDAVRAMKQDAGGPVVVAIRRGTYYLRQPVVFAPEDSGTEDAPIVYQAYRGEAPVISGGDRLDLKWEPYRDGILQANVPAATAFDQLFVDGVKQHLARYPSYDPNAQYFNGFAADCISPERVKRWSNPVGAIVHAMHRAHWGDFHYVVTGVDEKGHPTLEGGWQNNRRMGMHGSHRFVENVFEELDAPGEWYLDEQHSTLYFWPPAGVDLNQATVEVAVLRHLFEFDGSMNNPVEFVTLRGLTLRHTRRTFMEIKEPLLRSDWCIYRGGAVLMDGVEDCAIDDCTIDGVGGNGIFVSNYARRIDVTRCKLAEAGGNGVCFVGDPEAVRSPRFEYHETFNFDEIDKQPGPKTDNYPQECRVHDCLITRIGRVHKQSAAVQISMSQGITISHCSIYDVPRAGINISEGTWNGHLIEFCDVFDTVKETGDHGSFNSWGRDRFWHLGDCDLKEHPELSLLDAQTTTILRNNRWRCDHGWDIDLDDGSTNYHIYNNLCLNGGIKNREGFYRTVENNIMVNNGFHPHVWYEQSGDVFRRNIVFRPYRPARMSNTQPWGKEMDYNLHHDPARTGPATELQQGSRRDEQSIVGDAMFVDPASGNYQVQDGSPALALGFENFAMDEFGVVSPKLKAEAKTPVLPGAGPPPGVRRHAVGGRRKRDHTVHAWLGAKIKNVVGMGEVSSRGLPGEMGVLLMDVPEASPAAKAGLKPTDAILKCNGKQVDTVEGLLQLYRSAAPGSKVKLGVFREQSEMTVEIDRGHEIELHAGTARKHGTSGRYDPHKRFLGSWTREDTWLEWEMTVPKPGKYEVEIVQACPPNEAGSEYTITIGKASIAGTVEATGGWEHFATRSLGIIDLTETGELQVSLKPTKKPGVAVMNIRAIVLRPI